MFEIGDRVGEYEIVARLKSGGMATLFLAHRRGAAGFQRFVAIKVVHPHLASDSTFVRMFVDEALLSARIVHPNVVHVEELGEAEGTYFLVMEYVHGCSLSLLVRALARRKRMLAAEIATSIVMKVADGLHAAHETRGDRGELLGVVHRDVSPQNVLLAYQGHVKLIDFGIAKARGRVQQTTTTSLKGKIRYMAPEQAYGRPVDRRTDVYALAVVLWEMLTMRRMFTADNDFALLDMVRSPSPPPPSTYLEGCPPALDAAVMHALRPELDGRTPTAAEFRRELAAAMPSALALDASNLGEVLASVLGTELDEERKTITAALQGADQSGIQQSAAARAQFDPQIEYGQFWSKALYKVGWAYFRMQNGYPQALRNFAFLLDYYDFVGGEVAAQGNRTDTIKWIGVIFSESDWGAGTGDEGQRCQPLVETVARPPSDAVRPFDCAGVIRISAPYDPAQLMQQAASTTNRAAPTGQGFIPQDRPWTPEAYLELGDDYFQQTKYYEAIVLYRMFLQLYPLHYRAPSVAQRIAEAYDRQRQYDQAIAARGRLANYVEGSQWYNANGAHPDAQRVADSIARNSLHDIAIQYHQQASELRGQAAARRATDPLAAVELLRRANEKYGLAVTAYTQFIQSYPNDEAAYEFRYNRADALHWSRNYAEAARAYSDVRESNENDQYLAPAAYMAVKSQESAVRAAAQARQLDPCLAIRAGIPASELLDDQGSPLIAADVAESCTHPPAQGNTGPSAQQVVTLNIPDPVQALMDARIAYSNRVPQNLDDATALRDVAQVDAEHPENNPPYRPKFAYLNARTLLRYGHVDEALTLYRSILQLYCQDPLVARASIEDINNVYVQMGRQEDLERFAEEQQNRQCASAAPGTPAGQASGFNPTVILQNRQMRLALARFREAEQANASQAAEIYEDARRLMEEAVRSNRDHPQSALAMIYIAQAYERTGRFDSATQTYIRITQDFNATRNAQGQELEGPDLQQRITILDESNFRAGQNLERIFDYDNAIRYYGNLASDQRLARAEGHPARLHDALAAVAFITTNLGRWTQAAEAWRAFLPVATAGRERAEAEYRAAQIPFRAENWSEAIRSLQDYLRRSPTSADNAQFRVQAQYYIAMSNQRLGNTDAYRRALREVVTVFRASGQQPGSPAAAWAAEALYRDLDDQVSTFTRTTFTRGSGENLAQQLARLKTQLTAIDQAATAVVQLRGGEYSIGAITRQGEAHEHLATQEQQIPNLIDLSSAQQAQLRTAEAAIARVEQAADRLERANGNPDQVQSLRDRVQQLRDQIDQQRQGMIDTVRQRFDEEAEAERKLAIINYGLAVYTARNNNIPTPFAARALERLRAEDNQALTQAAFAQPNLPFPYRAGMFDGEAPGAVSSQQTPIATPGLVTE